MERLRDWLIEQQCTHVAIESTGVYWKPIFNILEPALVVVLANPEDVKARKGQKTDPKDRGGWLTFCGTPGSGQVLFRRNRFENYAT